MAFSELLSVVLHALRLNKLRSGLTLLGVIIGVMTVVSVLAVITGLNDYVMQKVINLNPDVLVFTKYGIIHGSVVSVSNDAINDEKLGLIYSTRVRMSKRTMEVEGKLVNLTPGMAVTVEVKTGKRRLIEYFLSPLLRARQESMRER